MYRPILAIGAAALLLAAACSPEEASTTAPTDGGTSASPSATVGATPTEAMTDGGMVRIDINNPDNTVVHGWDLSPSGAAEVGHEGNTIAGGSITILIETTPDGSWVVCVNGSFFEIVNVTGAHIHSGASDENGPVVVDLSGTASGGTTGEAFAIGCVDVDEATATAIGDNPAEHYFNIHTEAFPDGALRAQLA